MAQKAGGSSPLTHPEGQNLISVRLTAERLTFLEEKMNSPIPPHGGLSEPVVRMVPENEIHEVEKFARGLRRIPINNADLSTLNRIGDGGLSPLTGFMDRKSFERVLDEETIHHNGEGLCLGYSTIVIRKRRGRKKAENRGNGCARRSLRSDRRDACGLGRLPIRKVEI